LVQTDVGDSAHTCMLMICWWFKAQILFLCLWSVPSFCVILFVKHAGYKRNTSSGIWCRVVVVRPDVSEERIASIFRAGESRREYSERFTCPEYGGDTFLRNVGSNHNYTAPDPRRRLFSYTSPWKPKILHTVCLFKIYIWIIHFKAYLQFSYTCPNIWSLRIYGFSKSMGYTNNEAVLM
jgi:hypothetical protein